MQIEFGLGNLLPEWRESVVCIGTFDGVHLGHRTVISTAVEIARQEGLPACLVTFDRHPAAILHPQMCPPSIASLASRLRKFGQLGIDVAVVLPFDRELSELTASDFFTQILVDRLKAKRFVVGHDFAMGKSRVGDAEWLRARMPTEIVPPFEIHGRRVSSSLVRKSVAEGDLEEVALLLGDPLEIEGVVIGGDRLGRTLGYPTANVARGFNQVIPPDGVFQGWFTLGGVSHLAAVSIGTRPSVNGTDRRIEAFLLDYDGPEFYGQACKIQMVRMVRGQQKFEGLEALKEQIGKDVDQIRSLAMNSLLSASISQ